MNSIKSKIKKQYCLNNGISRGSILSCQRMSLRVSINMKLISNIRNSLESRLLGLVWRMPSIRSTVNLQTLFVKISFTWIKCLGYRAWTYLECYSCTIIQFMISLNTTNIQAESFCSSPVHCTKNFSTFTTITTTPMMKTNQTKYHKLT